MSANEVKTVQAAGLYTHSAPAGGGSVRVIKGKCAKGQYGSADCIGLIFFTPASLHAITTGYNIPDITLVLTRDASTGTAARTVSVTDYPLDFVDTTGQHTHEDVVNWGHKNPFKATVTGSESRIRLPGMMCRRISYWAANIIMLYHSEVESSNDYVAFTGARLEITRGDEWMAPVWNRPIAKGDKIFYSTRPWGPPEWSHRIDLLEIQWYINLRRRLNTLDNANVSLPDIVIENISGLDPEGTGQWLFSKWYQVISTLRTALGEARDAEGKPYSWSAITQGQIPSALAINELRNYLDEIYSPYLETTIRTIVTAGRAYYTTRNGFRVVDGTWTMDWRGSAPLSGKVQGKNSEGVVEYSHRFGFWFFDSILTGEQYSSMAITITSTNGQDRSGGGENNLCTLYPVLVSQMPARGSNVALGSVIDLTFPLDNAISAGVGSTKDKDFVEEQTFYMPSAFVQGVQNGQYFGVAVICDSIIRTWQATAKVTLNGPSPRPGVPQEDRMIDDGV